MLRILHLTDFHLNDSTLKDWKNFIKQALIAKLDKIHNERPLDIIAFTGDLIDKGGMKFSGADKAFAIFKTEVIDPLLTRFALPPQRFMMVPGNHDMTRDSDSELAELGARELLKNHEKVRPYLTTILQKGNQEGIKRLHYYKEFEKTFYENIPEQSAYITPLGSSFKIEIGSELIGVSCINSSWRCYDDNDKGRLVIGEDQFMDCYNFIQDCPTRILLMHHPFDWLIDFERAKLTNHATKFFDILLTGHVHETDTSLRTTVNGGLFINIAPSGLNNIQSDSRTFSNGFSVIDLNKALHKIDCHYWRYNHKQNAFVRDTDAADEGTLTVELQPISREKRAKNVKRIKVIIYREQKEQHFICRPATSVEVDLLYNDFIKLFGNDLMPPDTLKDIHKKNANTVMVIVPDDDTDNINTERIGFFEFFPLTEDGVSMLQAADGRSMNSSHICDPSTNSENYYIASIGASPKYKNDEFKKGYIMKLFREYLLISNKYTPLNLFARPVSEDGLHWVTKEGFKKIQQDKLDRDSVWKLVLKKNDLGYEGNHIGKKN